MNEMRERLVDALELVNELFSDLELPEQVRVCQVRRILLKVIADMERDPVRLSVWTNGTILPHRN